MLPLLHFTYSAINPVAVKSLMKAIGLPAGDLRKPLSNLEGRALAKGVRIVHQLGLDQEYGYKPRPHLGNRGLSAARSGAIERTMDLGIRGRKALFSGASRGLGKACALGAGARRRQRHHRRAPAATCWKRPAKRSQPPRKSGSPFTGDITTEAAARGAAACPDPDILVNNADGRPRGISATGRAKTGLRRWMP